jgi:hypothetical protein
VKHFLSRTRRVYVTSPASFPKRVTFGATIVEVTGDNPSLTPFLSK